MRRPSPKRRGCLFYGFLIGGILSVVVITLTYIAYQAVMNWSTDMVAQYTDTKAVEFPKVVLAEAEREALDRRVTSFMNVTEAQEEEQELVLTADEINVLLPERPSGTTNPPPVHLRIEENKILGDISIPLEDFGPFKLDGRYLNGNAVFLVNLTNDVLTVTFASVTVNDKPLPDIFMQELKRKNLAAEIRSDPKADEFLSKLKSIEIKNGRLHIRNKTKD